MTLVNIQPSCERSGLDIGVYNSNTKWVLPQTVKYEKYILRFIQKPLLCDLEIKSKN